jgi:flagellar protein FliO/FliZ
MDTFRATASLCLVLVLVLALAWVLKRAYGKKLLNSSVAKIVGGVSVGSRERIVVVEVAGRWLVVGVSAGRMTAIADLEPHSFAQAAKSALSSQTDTAL